MVSRIITGCDAFNGLGENDSRSRDAEEVRFTIRGITGGITGLVDSYSTDPAEIERFMNTKLFQEQGIGSERLQLLRHIINLEGPESPRIDTFVTAIRDEIDRGLKYSSYLGLETGAAMSTLTVQAPQKAAELGRDYPMHTTAINKEIVRSILNADPKVLGPEHAEAYESAEAALNEDFLNCLDIIAMKREKGILPMDDDISRAMALARSVRQNYQTYLEAHRPMHHEELTGKLVRAAGLAGRYASDDMLANLLVSDKWLTDDNGAKSLIIRRLAGTGQVVAARRLVDKRSTTIDSQASVAEPIENLLAIYEESGDELALDEAQRRIDEYMASDRLVKDFNQIRFAKHQLVAAARQGNDGLRRQAIETLEMFAHDNDGYRREQALGSGFQASLEVDDLDSALEYARRLMHDPYIINKKHGDRFDAMSTLLEKFVKTERVSEAEGLVAEMAVAQTQTGSIDFNVLRPAEYVRSGGRTYIHTMIGIAAVNPFLNKP